MAIKEKTSACATTKPKSIEAQKSAALRQFVDKNLTASVGITPKWQRAIDNYNRVKGNNTPR